MRTAALLASSLLLAGFGVNLLTQTSAPTGPTFEVVSIKLNTSGALPTAPPEERPDGGLTMMNIPISSLVGRAYSTAPIDMTGLPDWATRERYDVVATASLKNATRDD